MPYLKEHNLIFIHIPKTGGTSIEKAFGIYRKWDYSKLIHTKESVKNGITTAPQHWTPDLIEQYLGREVYNNSTKFTIVRNPYTRVLSEYFYRHKSAGTMDHFHKWFPKYYSNIDHDHKLPQYLYTNTTVDYIAKTESLQEDFISFVSHFNIKVNPLLEHKNKTKFNKQQLVNQIDSSIIDKINLLYEKDFLTFGYDFR